MHDIMFTLQFVFVELWKWTTQELSMNSIFINISLSNFFFKLL